MHFGLVITAEMQMPLSCRRHSFPVHSKNTYKNAINISCPNCKGTRSETGWKVKLRFKAGRGPSVTEMGRSVSGEQE